MKLKSYEQITKKLKEIGAEITPFMSNEKWVDDKGNIHYIVYAPMNWSKIQKGK